MPPNVTRRLRCAAPCCAVPCLAVLCRASHERGAFGRPHSAVFSRMGERGSGMPQSQWPTALDRPIVVSKAQVLLYIPHRCEHVRSPVQRRYSASPLCPPGVNSTVDARRWPSARFSLSRSPRHGVRRSHVESWQLRPKHADGDVVPTWMWLGSAPHGTADDKRTVRECFRFAGSDPPRSGRCAIRYILPKYLSMPLVRVAPCASALAVRLIIRQYTRPQYTALYAAGLPILR